MSTFPNFSEIPEFVRSTLNSRKSNQIRVSELNPWIRVASGVSLGLYIVSNPNYSLFGAAGSVYGNHQLSGTVGFRWDNTHLNTQAGQPYRPTPVISSLSIDEGAGEISRKASFNITAFSREQMETLCEYFLEPGFSIFIEWGWNTTDGVSGMVERLDSSVSRFQSFTSTDEVRAGTNGQYDNYLGFITGGDVSVSGETWNISVKCSGYVELPAYLNAMETAEQKSNRDEAKLVSVHLYNEAIADTEQDRTRQIWMRVFNDLPASRHTKRVKDLEFDSNIMRLSNFINFDEDAIDKVNSISSGRFFGRVFGIRPSVQVTKKDEKIRLPSRTRLSTEERYIKFSALQQIITTMGVDGIKVGDTLVRYKINSSSTYCSAFEHIFSLDDTRLFIPNPNTPSMIIGEQEVQSESGPPKHIRAVVRDQNRVIDNTIQDERTIIQFPIQEDRIIKFPEPTEPIYAKAKTYGKLDDLYVNFEFVKGILDTPNLFIKDALYQILNGISSAANGMWNFQIVEGTTVPEERFSSSTTRNRAVWGSTTSLGNTTTSQDENSSTQNIVSTELQIHELNFLSKETEMDKTCVFDLVGDNSIFIDASLNLNISGAKMNQIIGQRLGRSINSNAGDIPERGLFSPEQPRRDMLNVRSELNQEEPSDRIETTDSESDNDTTNNQQTRNVASSLQSNPPVDASVLSEVISANRIERSERDVAIESWLRRITFAPKVLSTKSSIKSDDALEDYTYMISYNDPALFSALQYGTKEVENTDISPLMPITFGFTIHGVSGIARGQKFKVRGIPKQYDNGFFQVLSVKHTIDDMIWKTEIEGGYRHGGQI